MNDENEESSMSLKDKYQPVIELIDELGTKNVKIWVDRGFLIIRGSAKDEHSKQLIMDKVHQVNIEGGQDIDIQLNVDGG